MSTEAILTSPLEVTQKIFEKFVETNQANLDFHADFGEIAYFENAIAECWDKVLSSLN